MFEDSIKKLETMEPLISMTGKPEIEAMSKFLYDRITHHDSYVVFLGETSSGKSSIINGLLGDSILPMKACPSTAAITEIELRDEVPSDEFYVINKNATIEKIDNALFLQFSEHPDKNLKRLKVIKHIGNKALNNLRIFDTPGYGSIVAEHEEVLKDFLPNSDIVIYTVNYKIGIQNEDYLFLGFLRELIRPDVKIFLLINRCPLGVESNSMKVKKISDFVSDILTIDPFVFTISNIEEEGKGHPLPHNEHLWNSVSQELSSQSRIQSLKNAFDGYIRDLYNECFRVIEARYLSAKLGAEEFDAINRIQQDTASRIEQAIPNIVLPAFERIAKILPRKFNEVRGNVEKHIFDEIEASSKLSMEEMVAYTNSHLLPHSIKVETREIIQDYIEIELDNLNKTVDDYLQKELIKFNNEITIVLQTNIELATSSILSNMVKNIGTSSLEEYFIAFGGQGGANAGIANAASHLLKKAGDIFGQKFSVATHNAVKQFLSKIGATSMKTVGAVVAVVVELLILLYQLKTWKKKLREKINKGLVNWQKETLPIVSDDLVKLRDENVETLKNIADDIVHAFDSERPGDIEKCKEEYNYSIQIGKQLGIE